MSTDYLPRREADLVTWSANFSTKITATPTAYGLTAGQATAYAALNTAWAAAYATANAPLTRSPANIMAKDDARHVLVVSARQLAAVVQKCPTVTNAQRTELGLTVRNMPAPIPAPGTPPGLEVVSVSGRVVKVRLFDPAHPTRRGKPPGVQGATVLSYVGATPPEDPTEFKFEGSASRTVVNIIFPTTVAGGSKVWLTGFWYNPRSASGPACEPVSTFLQFGGEMPMAA